MARSHHAGVILGHEGRASWRRVFGALVLGHVAAALSFGVFTVTGAFILDPAVSTTPIGRLLADMAAALLLFVVMAPIVMLPASLLTSPFTILAARRFRAGAGTALTVGAAIGATWVLSLFRSELSSATWSRAGLPGDPRTLAMIVLDGAVAGMAYAWVVWSRCIRPCLDTGRSLHRSPP